MLLGQKYFGWGSESVKLLRDIKNGKQPASPIIDSGVDVVTKDNVEQYEQQWKEWRRTIEVSKQRCGDVAMLSMWRCVKITRSPDHQI